MALTEAAIGSGVTGMLLINAGGEAAPGRAAGPPPRAACALVAGIACALVAVGLGSCRSTRHMSLRRSPNRNGQSRRKRPRNPVARVLFVYRAFDTLLEKVVSCSR